MTLTRRTTLLGLGAALAFPTPALAKSASRDYLVTFGKTKVGRSSISIGRKGSRVTVKYAIKTKANLLVVKYKYGIQATEVWEDGRLISLNSTAYENDRKFAVTGKAVKGGFSVDGTRFNGVIKGNPGTTTYWTPEILNRKVWISSQTGRPLNVKIARRKDRTMKTPAGDVACAVYHCSGDLKRSMDLFYDKRGEWVGNEMKAFGSRARFLAESLNPTLAQLF